MPSPLRLAPLWRSSGWFAARSNRAATAAARLTGCCAASMVAAASAAQRQHERAGRAAGAAAAADVSMRYTFGMRRYSDDASPRSDGREAAADAAQGAGLAAAQDTQSPLEPQQQQQQQHTSEKEAFLEWQRQQQRRRELEGDESSSSGNVYDPASAESESLPPETREALRQLELLSKGVAPFDPDVDGHKFGLTTAPMALMPEAVLAAVAATDSAEETNSSTGMVPFPLTRKLQERYDPVIMQLTRLLMRDGKLAKAQRDMALILNYLRTSPPPKLSPACPLLPGHPPAAQLPLDPVGYLTLALDSVAPLIKIRSYANMAGGGKALPVPVPLAVRQRRRAAFMWLLDVVQKRPSRGSGRNMLAHRIGEEIVAIAEGRSALWDRRQMAHRLGTGARENVSKVMPRR